jgi:hypothetical protein
LIALQLCDLKGRFLFEVRPDLIPEGYLTGVECALWSRYYTDKNARQEQR